MTKSLLLNMAIEIVDLAITAWWISIVVLVYQRVAHMLHVWSIYTHIWLIFRANVGNSPYREHMDENEPLEIASLEPTKFTQPS